MVRAFVEEHGLTFPVLLDPDRTVARMYGLRGVPYSLVIDREGVIKGRHIGPMTEELIAKVLEEVR